jgi:hypothetical protein
MADDGGPPRPGGELKLLTSILRDLRDQKAVESRLRESEAALRVLNAQLAAGDSLHGGGKRPYFTLSFHRCSGAQGPR